MCVLFLAVLLTEKAECSAPVKRLAGLGGEIISAMIYSVPIGLLNTNLIIAVCSMNLKRLKVCIRVSVILH